MRHPDISHHHKVKSWAKLEKDCDFIISKATEGTVFTDPTLKAFVKNCESRKIPYWLYVFLKDGNELKQAQFMVKKCKPIVGKYFQGYILDIESHNSEAACIEALKYIKKQSKKTMIYTMYAQYDKYKKLVASRGATCAWWEARYGANNGHDTSDKYPAHAGVDLHQYTSEGSVDYLDGKIDLNKMTGKKPLSFFTGSKPAAKTKKTYPGKLPTLPDRKYFKIGDKGSQVKLLQDFLIWAGFSVGTAGADGIYGPATSKAVLAYKKAVGLSPNDGNFGKKSLAKAKTYKKKK